MTEFNYDKDRDVTEIYLEKNDLFWRGTHEGEVTHQQRMKYLDDFLELYLQQDSTTALECVGLKRIFSLDSVETPAGERVHFLVEECDCAFEMQVDKYFILKLADELREYAEEKM